VGDLMNVHTSYLTRLDALSDDQIIAIYNASTCGKGGTLKLNCHGSAILDVRHVLACRSVEIAARYLKRRNWVRPTACARSLRQTAKRNIGAGAEHNRSTCK